MKTYKLLPLVLLGFFCACQNNDKAAVPVNENVQEQMDSLCLPSDSLGVDKDKISSCISEDGSMKFYCWDTGQGGTCPDFAVYCQFRTKDGKVKTEDLSVKEGEPAWVSAVHAIKKNDGTTYYIATRSHRLSSNDGYMWMEAFVIDNDTLKYVNVYDGGDDIDENGLDIEYSIADWYYATNGYGEDWLFEYDEKDKNLYVPLTVSQEYSLPFISDRYKVFHFNGNVFEDKGESAHKGLHPSLSNYYRIGSYFRTKNYLVRVDWMDNKGTLRYASWKSTLDMSKQPDITIPGGKYNEKEDSYTFTNDGYEYIVGFSENIPISEGVFERHEFLQVSKNGKVVLKEERISAYDE